MNNLIKEINELIQEMNNLTELNIVGKARKDDIRTWFGVNVIMKAQQRLVLKMKLNIKCDDPEYFVLEATVGRNNAYQGWNTNKKAMEKIRSIASKGKGPWEKSEGSTWFTFKDSPKNIQKIVEKIIGAVDA